MRHCDVAKKQRSTAVVVRYTEKKCRPVVVAPWDATQLAQKNPSKRRICSGRKKRLHTSDAVQYTTVAPFTKPQEQFERVYLEDWKLDVKKFHGAPFR